MTIKQFNEILQNKILVLDGATGTELQKRGMPKGVCPEKWVSENPSILIDVQKSYKDAGTNIVYSCTFGANRYKLEEFGLQDEVYQLNKKLAEISRDAVGKDSLVAGDLAPTGKFIEPFGDVSFNDAVAVYKEQVKGLLDGGVDLFVIETMLDIQEMRAALIAVKESCDLPVICTMTFAEDGLTLTGTDSLAALITLQSLGASAFGCNCSVGPEAMLKLIKNLKPYAKIPLLAKPNAGLPKLIDGKTVFDMDKDEFGSFVPQFAEVGVNLFGGCCGTSPEYIKVSAEKLKNAKPILPKVESLSAVSSSRKGLLLTRNIPLVVIGERINPTGKKTLQAQLKEGKFDEVRRFASEQAESGAKMLDVNMGMSGIDEKEMMLKSVKLLSTASDLPLAIDSSNPDVIEAALRVYPGRALINSISNEKKKIEKLLPIAAKYGAMFILLPLNDDEIPQTADGRIKEVNKVFTEAQKLGFTKDDIVVDGLVLTVSADQNAAKETLKLINWCSNEFGVNTTVGLSNVSFGLPERKLVNAAFLAMAMYNGLSMAIANPNEEILMNSKLSSDVLTGNDKGSKEYIAKFSNIAKETITKPKDTLSINELIYQCVIEGNKETIVEHIKKAIEQKIEANVLVNDSLIKAINKVGDLYDKKVYFLPQLIASAEAMKSGFAILEPLLTKKEGDLTQKAKVILATVKGDIHDIGKNIVGLMLKNYGFDVIDLGKDVPAETIIEEALKQKASLIGLSALMTTTMVEMKTVVQLAKAKNVSAKIFIGGAVISEQYAEEIEANGYAKDSIEAVKIAKKLCGMA
ncbi:MAG: 5-methyltetrahydrofolate--homocysteine methyltransferase [Spirochaetes bacterium GWD1_27_9]|nr:MAG: 5-methyltetrahydrofolate--homocysteine methyltransferase [Spirochaetes bacterium GWC1_27_15]OHD38279.1 MAG: 5-methyltetrahydrofolate--homocysteine methyltransferase [Spirochaetes bacterium GWD1_27_9]